jgi:omega-amidase
MGLLRIAAAALDPRVGAVEQNLASAHAALAAAAARGVALLALPEMWPTSFTAEVDEGLVRAGDAAVADLAAKANALGVTVVGSAYAARAAGPPANRAHVLGPVDRASPPPPASAPAGHDRAQLCAPGYDKVHLFSPTAEHLLFSAGDSPPPVVAVGPVRLAPIVCYDLRFPDLVRAPIRAGAELLVVVAQWPDARAAAWRALVAGRAAEGECFVLAANRRGTDEIGRRRLVLTFGGHTLVAGPDGAVLAAGPTEDGLLVHDIDLEEVRAMRRAVPVLRDERPELYARFARGAADAPK